jgi:hypothetical protein
LPKFSGSWTPPTIIQKEISKGIFLIKEFVQKPTQGEGTIDQFIFSVKN